MARRGPAVPSPKAEALKAIDEVVIALDGIAKGGRMLTPLEWMKLGITAGYARVQIEKIQELKKQRRTPSATPPSGDPRQ